LTSESLRALVLQPHLHDQRFRLGETRLTIAHIELGDARALGHPRAALGAELDDSALGLGAQFHLAIRLRAAAHDDLARDGARAQVLDHDADAPLGITGCGPRPGFVADRRRGRIGLR